MNVLVEKNVEAKMRDGTILRADIYRPATDGRWPVLLMRTPYKKELDPARTIDVIGAAQQGYAVAIQDVRGRWSSDGDVFFMAGPEEEDGYDSVEWATSLPFSDGNVGMFGVSYPGWSSWAAAVAQAPGLGAIAPSQVPNDLGQQTLWRGGAFSLGFLVRWSLQSIAPGVLTRRFLRSGGAAKDLTSIPGLVELLEDIDQYERDVRHMPITELPSARPEDHDFLPFFFEFLKKGQEEDFTGPSISGKHKYIRVPALILGGWYDSFLASDLEHYRAMRQEAETEEAREQTRLVIGPWTHAVFGHEVGEVNFGMRSSGQVLDLRYDLATLHIRWFDRWLKGKRNGVDDEPRVMLFTGGANRWRYEDDWPLSHMSERRIYLRAEGRLGWDSPSADDGSDVYVYDPENPCPTRGGTLLMTVLYTRGPVDQAPLLGRRDMLVYTSEPLQEELEVTGHVRAVLEASTSGPSTDWVVKLCDVYPDGRTYNVCDGILRTQHRSPDEVAKVEIDLWATSWAFQPGHRIRVVVTSSDFPRYDRNPNTGERGVDATRSVPALQRVFHNANKASHLVLPIVDR